MRKFHSRISLWRLSALCATGVAILGVALSVPLVYYLMRPESSSDLLALAVPWVMGVLALSVTVLVSWSRRSHELRSDVSLHVDLLGVRLRSCTT